MNTRLRFKVIATLISLALICLLLGQGYWLTRLFDSSRITMMENMDDAIRMADYKELFARMDTLKKRGTHDTIEYKLPGEQDTTVSANYSEDLEFKEQDDTLDSFLQLIANVEVKIQEAMHLKVDSLMPIDYTFLDNTLASELKTRNLTVPYKLQVIQPRMPDSVRYASPDTADRARSWKNAVQIRYPISAGKYYYNLLLLSPDQMIFRQMAGVLVSSALLVAIILGAFAYLLYVILRQKTIEELKTDFTNNMTHELKTPISVAYAANDVLLNYNNAINEKQQKYLTIVREQLTHLSGLVEQILTLSVENRSTFRLNPESIQIAELLPALVEQYKLKTGKSLTISTEVSGDIVITADRTHLYNMLSNLIENAIKYSGEKPCSISIKAVRLPGENRLSVSDNGIGISEANLKRIFDKFFRVPSGNLHNVKGYGLGLYYVNDMMAKHGGSVTVKSQLGKGSTFTLHFKN